MVPAGALASRAGPGARGDEACAAQAGACPAGPAGAPETARPLRVSVAVIGAGPAGLGVASALRSAGCGDFLVFDAGKPFELRDRADEEDSIIGVGGAGLYSDGKFSFYPSASGLWKLERADLLQEAFRWTAEQCERMLRVDGLDERTGLPSFPIDESDSDAGGRAGRCEPCGAPPGWQLKSYLSLSTSLAARMELCGHLYESGGGAANFRLSQRVVLRTSASGGFDVLDEDSLATLAHAQRLVIAGGRFWPLLYGQALEASARLGKAFRRVEFGARLVAPSSNAFFSAGGERHEGNADPKWIFQDPETGVEYRTFCYCREGEVVQTAFGTPPLRTCSGRADGPANGTSNIGFNCRVRDPQLAQALIDDGLFDRCRARAPFSCTPLDDGSLALHYGERALAILRRGVALLCEQHPCLQGQIVLSGPTIEGVGAYPLVDSALRVLPIAEAPAGGKHDIFACGDASGLFRGIVASMCSGHYVGLQLLGAMPGEAGRKGTGWWVPCRDFQVRVQMWMRDHLALLVPLAFVLHWILKRQLKTLLLLSLVNVSEDLEAAAVAYMLSALVNSACFVHPIKDTCRVPRPAWVLSERDLSVTHVASRSYSFPSGHTMMVSFGLSFLLVSDPGRWYVWGPLWCAGCLVMGGSRIILGCHWFMDVAFSVLWGPVIAACCIYVLPVPYLRDARYAAWAQGGTLLLCCLATAASTLRACSRAPAEIRPGLQVKETNFGTDLVDVATVGGVLAAALPLRGGAPRAYGLGPALTAAALALAWMKLHDVLVLFLRGYGITFTERTGLVHKAPAYLAMAFCAAYFPGRCAPPA